MRKSQRSGTATSVDSRVRLRETVTHIYTFVTASNMPSKELNRRVLSRRQLPRADGVFLVRGTTTTASPAAIGEMGLRQVRVQG